MDKLEYRDVIRYLFLKGNTPSQIKDEFDSLYGDSAPSYTTVKFWAAEFKCGRKNLGDDDRTWRPKTATTAENIANVHQMVLDDRRIKVREIAEVYELVKRTYLSFRHEKAVRALGAAFVHVRPKKCLKLKFEWTFSTLFWRSLGEIKLSFGAD